VMPKAAHVPFGGWTYYIRVADIGAAHKAIVAGGGTVLHGPQEVPGGDYIIVGIDPQGASFGLVGKKA
jgi:predicted enzyme related to lactoylglutathione lyase